MTASLLLMLASVVLAQERNVTGKVTDENGSGMPGVNVLVKGTSTGTATDSDGGFAISVPNDQATLVFTFVGYATNEVAVGSRATLDVQLTPDVETLSELVVTGYQVLRKADISGAVAVVDASQLQTIVASSFAQKLQGRAAGVNISTSGAPGDATNVRIRGIGSFGNNDPLYVIDGVQYRDKGSVNLNPNDIETMQVLKDPATAAIYGVGAGNGVVVITTKQGKAGKTKLSYNGSYSVANSVKGWDDILITDSQDYLDMTNQFFTNGNQALPNYAVGGTLPKYIYVNPTLNGENSVGNTTNEAQYDRYSNPIMLTSPGTNWWKEITRPAKTHDHTLSVSGGSENSTFMVGAGILVQEGVLKFNDFRRYNVRANSSFKVGKKFRMGENMNFTNRTGRNNPAQSEQGVLSQVYKIAPIIPVYDIGTSVDEDGMRDSFGGSKTANTGNAANPYAMLFRGRKNTTVVNNIMGNFYGELDIIKGLTARTDFKYDVNQQQQKQFTFRSPENQENQGAQNFQETWGTGFAWIWTNTLAYNATFAEKHNLSFLAGYETQKGRGRNIFGSVNNYFSVTEDIWYLNTAFGAADTRQVNSTPGADFRKISMFGKVDYNLSDKYYLTATVRRDGSSVFSPENRFGVFPAFSAAWRISGESFMANSSVINDLKLRASYGEIGSDASVNAYNFLDRWGGTVGSGFYAIDGANGGSTTGYHLQGIGTNSLNLATSWESQKATNIGFDATLLSDKVTFVFDWFTRETQDLLYNKQLAGTIGYLGTQSPYQNTASMKNTGFEISLGYKTEINDLKLGVDLNLSRYKNEILSIAAGENFFYPNAGQGRIDNRLPQQFNINQVGYPISSFRGYEVAGIIDSEEELDAQPGSQMGGLQFRDINGDGDITDSDLTIIGSPHPDFTYGLNLTAGWKNFDLTMFFVGSKGNEIFNYTRLFTHFRQFFSNVSKEYYEENGTGDAPRLNILDTSSRSASEYYVENGSYFRLGQITLGYQLPVPAGLQNTLSGARIYVQGQNLFTITKYSGLDPALSNANIGDGRNLNDIWNGFDIGQYPNNRLVTIGVSANF
jgi:TonB-dependent starch-binding outer membrane protein SusC